MKKNLIIIFGAVGLLFGNFQKTAAQSVDIDFIEVVGRNIVVHYNLDDGANSVRQFMVQLYTSQDNFTTPLTRVTGDFGPEVTSGFDKRIVWDITKELGSFKGDLSFQLRGRVYVPFVKIQEIETGRIFKHGKNYPLNWTSGNLSGQVNIELFNEAGERIWGENNVANVGKFDWFIPGSVRKGKNYKLKFTNVRDRNDVVYSAPFIIKPKIPFLVKAAGVLVIAGGVGYLATEKSKTPEAAAYGPPVGPPTN